jgi:hypothetical protein
MNDIASLRERASLHYWEMCFCRSCNPHASRPLTLERFPKADATARGGLSPRKVGHMRRILRQALQQAVRWQVLARNPADAVRPRQTDDVHVIAQVDGQPLMPQSPTHEFARFIASTALPRVRFHDLRHTHATHLLASGVHPKIAQERLGHANIGTTLDLYSHVLPGMQADAASRVDAALKAALDKHRNAKG